MSLDADLIVRPPPHAAQAHLLARRRHRGDRPRHRWISRAVEPPRRVCRRRRLYRAGDDLADSSAAIDERVQAARTAGAIRAPARAVVVHVDSPGGTVTGSEALYENQLRLPAKKPIVAVVDGLAASGGYIAAMGSDRIVARQTSLVGSIGVLFQIPNVGQLMNTIGVKLEEVKSSPLKASPNGFEPTSPRGAGRAAARRRRQLRLVQAPGARAPASWPNRRTRRGLGRPRSFGPTGAGAQARRRDRRREGGDRLARAREGHRRQCCRSAGLSGCTRRFAEPAVPACRRRCRLLDAVGLATALPAASTQSGVFGAGGSAAQS